MDYSRVHGYTFIKETVDSEEFNILTIIAAMEAPIILV